MTMGFSIKAFALSAALAVSAIAGEAATYNFVPVTSNSSTNATIGSQQLSVDVADSGNGTVSFTFART